MNTYGLFSNTISENFPPSGKSKSRDKVTLKLEVSSWHYEKDKEKERL